MPSRQACQYRWATGSRCAVISGLLRGLTSYRPDVKRSMAIVRPVTGRGAGLAGWPLPRMVPVWSVFQPRFVLPVKESVMTTSILVTGAVPVRSGSP
jgi:hypothetical protein